MIDFHKQWPNSGKGKTHEWVTQHLKQLLYRENTYGLGQTVLEYGCGQGQALIQYSSVHPSVSFRGYDPYKQEYNTPELLERKYDVVYSIDVLEHIPREQCVNHKGAIELLSNIAEYKLLVIDLTPAKKTLADGTNAHVNLQTAEAWLRDLNDWMYITKHTVHTEPDKTYGERKRLCVVAN